LLGVREVGAIRSDAINEVQNTGRMFGRLSLRVPRVIVANSKAAIRNAISMGVSAARLHLLPNVVDTDKFKPASRSAGDHIRLLAVGRLGKEKRFDRFLSVLDRVQRQSPIPVRGIIVGDGPERERLELQAKEMALLPDCVQFAGAVSDMTNVYQEADILVLTSDWEGTPNVVFEAMASRLPVVATRVGGMEEIIQHGETGILANAEDEPAMVNSLLMLINDSKLRLRIGNRAREYVTANHSQHRLPDLLSGIYEVALS